MPPTREEFIQSEVYTLSIEELTSPPTEIEQYHVGGRVTRNNFLHFLIKSFAISRGSIQSQLLFFEWIKRRFGFDFYGTIQKLNINIYHNFSEEEKNVFREYFNKIPAHKGFDIIEGITELDTRMDYDKYQIEDLYLLFHLDLVETESDFVKKISTL